MALGPGRARLLEAIEAGGSITHAASVLGVSYRTAWNRVEQLNTEASAPLVTTRTGGPHGGGARLTPEGRRALAAYRLVEARTREALDEANRELARLLTEEHG